MTYEKKDQDKEKKLRRIYKDVYSIWSDFKK